ncbi:phenolic glucoside malonyltransferase 1-like, partial [Mangifera indica]|uniref:phenolic glucoside malonyltransferase 1-like n=1 Tax=Mangifera indica TaxID=29780 RepID=UPI001CFB2872
MASFNNVKIQEVSKVTSPFDSITEFSLPLTLYDTYWFNFPPVERLYLYQITHLTPHFFTQLSSQTQHSLSPLSHFLHYFPLAGNLTGPDASKPFIYYSPDVGVSVTVGESTADFNSLSDNGVHEAAELHPLIPQLVASDDKAAVIAVQITLLP